MLPAIVMFFSKLCVLLRDSRGGLCVMLAAVDGVPTLRLVPSPSPAESPLTLLVSLRMLPGKLPAGPIVVGVVAAEDAIRGDEKIDCE